MRANAWQRAHMVQRIRTMRQWAPKVRRRKPPRQIHPSHIALTYFKNIRGYLDGARGALERSIFPQVPGWIADAKAQRGDDVRLDRGADVNREIDKIAKRYMDDLSVNELERLAETTAGQLSDFQRQQLKRQITAIVGVDVLSHEPNLQPIVDAFTAENVALIKSIPQQYFGDIEKRITAGVRSGTRWEDLAQELQDRYDVSESRAALIARDQVGKFYGELNEVRQTALGVKSFIWRTANDERVREEHADLEGETFDWDTPPSEGIPGEAVNCRCFAEPVLDDLLSES